MCSYFTHFADTPEQERCSAPAGSATTEGADPGPARRPQNRTAQLRYFVDIVDRLHKVKPQDLTETRC